MARKRKDLVQALKLVVIAGLVLVTGGSEIVKRGCVLREELAEVI